MHTLISDYSSSVSSITNARVCVQGEVGTVLPLFVLSLKSHSVRGDELNSVISAAKDEDERGPEAGIFAHLFSYNHSERNSHIAFLHLYFLTASVPAVLLE